MKPVGGDGCEVARHYGSRTFYASPEGLVGVRTKGATVWHYWSTAAGGFVVVGSSPGKGGRGVTQFRCNGVARAVQTFKGCSCGR